MDEVKLVIISDTHGMHDRVELPEGDALIHCGDWSARSTERDTTVFSDWLTEQPFKYKICIAGNHDKYAGIQYFDITRGVVYLEDDSVTLDGVNFYGMPWTPTFHNWYWMKDPGPEMQAKVDLIPEDTNVLLTHGPAYDMLDDTEEGISAGCEALQDHIPELKRLKVHCFGHIHEAYGDNGGYADYLAVNASQVNRQMELVNKPIAVEI